MKKLSDVPGLYFDGVRNVGDLVGPSLVSCMTGRRVAPVQTLDDEHFVGVGSLLSLVNEYSHIWGTGLSHPSVGVGSPSAQRIYALRGKLTHEHVRRTGRLLKDIPLGDPGFLAARFFDLSGLARIPGKIGVVAHYVDRQHPYFQNAFMREDVADLNVHCGISDFLRAMRTCDVVVSSSLHGLIFAESMGIPNIWIKVSDKVLGEGFKFHDWFSIARRPCIAPWIPIDGEDIEIACRSAELHELEIDPDALANAFPYASVQDMADRQSAKG